MSKNLFTRFLRISAAVAALALLFCFSVFAYSPEELIPMGITTGIRLRCVGPMVVGFAEGKSPARDAGLETGDIITSVDGNPVTSNEELLQALSECKGAACTINAERDGKPVSFRIVSTDEGVKMGAWVRDRMSGIGTVTFVDPKTGLFGSLGHAICDVDTGVIMPAKSGTVMPSSVESVVKGKPGNPGELQGSFDLTVQSGEIYKNCEAGIIGKLSGDALYKDMKAMPWTKKNEIKEGSAVILANVEGTEVQEYDVKIVKIYSAGRDNYRDMMIEVTDKDLISATGGIVQGMSGSPIIQNGKIIGAVTHVLVNDPTRGYGIFIENMLDAAE